MATSRARSIGEASVRGRDEAARSAQSLAIEAETFFVCAHQGLAPPHPPHPRPHSLTYPTKRSQVPIAATRQPAVPTRQPAVPDTCFRSARLSGRPVQLSEQGARQHNAPAPRFPNVATRQPAVPNTCSRATLPGACPNRAVHVSEQSAWQRRTSTPTAALPALSRARSRCLSYARVACTSHSRRHSHTQRSRDAIPLRALSVGYTQFAPLHLHP